MEDHTVADKTLRYNLVLGGGAARGAFHLGVLEYMDQNKLYVEAISGSSIGSIIGASYAGGVSPKEQLAIFKSKEFKRIFQNNWLRGSLLRIDKNAPVLDRLLPLKTFEELPLPVYATAFDLVRGRKRVFERGCVLDALLASSALIPLFPTRPLGEGVFVDGGFVDNLPSGPFAQSPLPTVGVNLYPQLPRPYVKKGILANMKRLFFLGWSQFTKRGLQGCDMEITHPKLDGYGVFNMKNLDELFYLGFKSAQRCFEKDGCDPKLY